MIFRQLFDTASSTYTYLLADPASRKAVLIDTVFEQHARDEALIRELGLELVWVLDTHCHADHVTGAWLMKATLGAKIASAKVIGAEHVDRGLVDGDRVEFGAQHLDVHATPGHTDGCLVYVTADRSMVFTGDALLIRGAGRTDFQQGNARALFASIHKHIFSLPDTCTIYPGHDYEGRTSSTVAEEKQWNPRIGGGAREEDFVGYMQNLGLPHPKQIAVAVPANLRSGCPEDGKVPQAADWGPVKISYGGIPEVTPEWVASHRADVHLLDVRSAAEWADESFRVAGATLLPIDDLRARVAEIPRDKPIVTLCHTGKRSAMAAVILKKAGIERVANVSGGLVAWTERGLPRNA